MPSSIIEWLPNPTYGTVSQGKCKYLYFENIFLDKTVSVGFNPSQIPEQKRSVTISYALAGR